MNIKRVDDIFHIKQGHQITEENIYNSYGDVPIITGNNINVGFVNTHIISHEYLPCISYPTKGHIGNFYIQNNIFEANNTGILDLKEQWKNKIDFYWAISQLSPEVKKACNSKFGVGYIGKDIMERIKIDVPDINKQKTIGGIYYKMLKLKENIQKYKSCIKKKILNLKIKNPPNSVEYKIENIFDIIGGNSGLTSELLYNNQPNNEKEKISILSSATFELNSMGYISRYASVNRKKLKIFNSPSILITRNGYYAGTMLYITLKEFATNDHAYVLAVKKEWENKINLRWFVNQYQHLFYRLVTSKSDNATFNKCYAEKQKVKIPDKESFQDVIAEILLSIDNIINYLNTLEKQVDELLEYKII